MTLVYLNKLKWTFADSGMSENLALTSESESEIFCDSVDSVEQLGNIKVWCHHFSLRSTAKLIEWYMLTVKRNQCTHRGNNTHKVKFLTLFITDSSRQVQRFSQQQHLPTVLSWSGNSPGGATGRSWSRWRRRRGRGVSRSSQERAGQWAGRFLPQLERT